MAGIKTRGLRFIVFELTQVIRNSTTIELGTVTRAFRPSLKGSAGFQPVSPRAPVVVSQQAWKYAHHRQGAYATLRGLKAHATFFSAIP